MRGHKLLYCKSHILNTEDSTGYDALVAYVEALGFVQHAAKGGGLVDENGELVTEPLHINDKELLECGTVEEPKNYLSNYFILYYNMYVLLSSFSNSSSFLLHEKCWLPRSTCSRLLRPRRRKGRKSLRVDKEMGD